jgi:Tfp pilus assembly protein PilV
MKKINKLSGAKGFTLVETMLAVFILVTVSTMLINGFVTTMAYSYQTSIYSKSSANNYKACMNNVARWSHLDNLGTGGREAEAISKGYYGANTQRNLIFYTGGNVIDSLYVAEVAKTNLELTVPTTVSYGAKDYTPNNLSYADNHKAIVYYPQYCKDGDDSTIGKIVVKYDATDGKYYWVVNNGHPTLDGATVVSGSSAFN